MNRGRLRVSTSLKNRRGSLTAKNGVAVTRRSSSSHPPSKTSDFPTQRATFNTPFTFRATGGRKKLSWKIMSGSGDAFTSPPTIAASNADGTEAVFSGKTIVTITTASWKGRIRVTDADGRFSEKDVEMRVVFALPKPTIKSFSPAFGWPGVVPSEPTPVIVTVTSTGKDFDSRESNATRVFFNGASGSVEGQLVPGELTSSQLRVRVPKGATPGALRVKTAFGEGASSKSFIAHPYGYRFISGFSFENRCDDDDYSDGFPNTFDWLRFEQTLASTRCGSSCSIRRSYPIRSRAFSSSQPTTRSATGVATAFPSRRCR